MVDQYYIPQKQNAHTKPSERLDTGIQTVPGTSEIDIEQYDNGQGITTEITIQATGSVSLGIRFSSTSISIVHHNAQQIVTEEADDVWFD
jgi:hypothetical protein